MASESSAPMDTQKDAVPGKPMDFHPRPYQVELFECAKKKNSILVLGTGSGKTFISILLIKELADEIRGPLSQKNKRTVFVVNTVPLVYQQAAAIELHTPYEVGKYEGSMGVDYWTDEHWKEELEKHEVVVVVAQIFLDLILHARLPLSMVNLLIMDECHHATGNHPMRGIMREYERLKQHSPEEVPRVMGLTACVVHRKCKKNKVLTYMKNLEVAMDCALVTSDDPVTVLQYTTGPKEIIVCFSVNDKLSEYQEIVQAQLLGLQVDITTEGDLDEKAGKQIKKKIANIINIMETLGDWCVARAIKYEVENLEEAVELEEDYKVRMVLTLLRKRLIDICESCKLKEKNMTNPLENVTCQVKRLIELLSKCTSDVFGLIFVERRNTAKILYDLLLAIAKQNQEFSFVKPSYVVGCNTRPGADIRLAELELRKQKETLEKFRNGESNFLISTSVLEEGVDIRKCNLVVRFDMPKNYRGYVQSRGRARAKPSIYALMVKEANLTENRECIEVYREIEHILQYLCHDRELPKPEDTRKHFEEDEHIPPYEPFGPNKPKITINSAIPLVNMYCSKLPADKFTSGAPVVKTKKTEGKYVTGIRLPIMAPMKEMIYGEEFDLQDLAKKSAAMKLCIKLHEMGELNDTLRPKEHDDESLVEGIVELPPEEPTPQGCSETGTRKRKRIYKKEVCKSFSDMQRPMYFLYTIDIIPTGSTTSSVTIDSSACNAKMGFICKEGLAVSPFELFSTKWDAVMVKVKEIGPLVDLDLSLFEKIKKFHRLVFENLLELKSNLIYFNPKESNHDVYIVPLDASGILNLDMLNDIYTQHSLRPSLMCRDKRRHFKYERSAYEDALVYPLYMPQSDTLYYVSKILDHVKPFDSLDKDYTYEQYFLEKYNVRIETKDQPLFEAKHFPKEFNYLKKVVRNSKHQNTDRVPLFVPELCGIMPIKASLWWQISLIPSILHRLNSLNIIHDFIIETKVLPPHPVMNEMLDFNWTTSFIQEKINKEDPLSSFLEQKSDFIHPFKMLQAFTLKEAGEDENFNLERLELLGDSFLKFSTGEALFMQNEKFQEGRLSLLRGKLVCNKTLYLLANQKGLASKILAKVFSPKINGFLPGFCVKPLVKAKFHEYQVPSELWNQLAGSKTDMESIDQELRKISEDAKGPCCNPWTTHVIGDKNIADCTEAIMGAYLLVCGRQAAISFMNWLGIGVYKGTSILCTDYPVKTSCVRPQYAQDVENFYRKAGLDRLEEKIGYRFRDRSFVVQAVTHTSYTNNQVTDCYQRLEFLGDAVLDFLVTCHIFFCFRDYTPGQLTDLRSYIVKNETLGKLALKIKLHQHMLHMSPALETAVNKLLTTNSEDLLSKELNTEEDVDDLQEVDIPKALGDMVESLIGAVYLDSNKSLTDVWIIIQRILGNLLNTPIERIQLNPIRVLYEKVPKKVHFYKVGKNMMSVEVGGHGTFTANAKNLRLAKIKVALKALSSIH